MKYSELNRNEITTYQNLKDAAKALLRGKFIALYNYVRKEERPQINDLSSKLSRKRRVN